MAYHATGRTRDATIACERLIRYTDASDSSTAASLSSTVLGCSISYVYTPLDFIWVPHPTDANTWRGYIRYSLEVSGGVRGGGVISDYQEQEWFGEYFASIGMPTGNPHGVFNNIEFTATLDVTLGFTELVSTGASNGYEAFGEALDAATWSWAVSGTLTADGGHLSLEEWTLTWDLSGADSDTYTPTTIDVDPEEWAIEYEVLGSSGGLNPGRTVTAALSAPGIAWTAADASASSGGITTSGTPQAFTVQNTGTSATITAEFRPDWALDWDIDNRLYEDGSQLTGVDTDLRSFDTIISSGTTAHRYPTTDYKSYSRVTVGVTDIQLLDQAFARMQAGNSTRHNHVWVNEDWADDYGTYVFSNSGQGHTYGLKVGPEYEAGTISVDETHLFELFEPAPLIWATFSGYLGLTYNSGEGAVQFVTTVGFPNTIFTDPAEDWRFKPFGYRYYRFDAWCDQAKSFVFQITQSTGASSAYIYEYDFSLPADEWTTLQLDILFPDRIYLSIDGVGTSLVTPQFLVHPDFFRPFNDDHSISIIVDTADEPVYRWKDFTGYLKTTGDRLPLYLGGGQTEAYETYEICSDNDIYTGGIGGAAGHQLLVNGAKGYTLGNTSKTAMDALKAFLDDATGDNDTGIDITVGTSFWAERGFHEAIRAGEPSGVAMTPGTPETLWGQDIELPHGYYGFGAGPGGSYAADIAYVGVKLWNGEVAVLIANETRTAGGVDVELVDDDGSETVIDTQTSNDDGLLLFDAKYGVFFPYSNAAIGDSCASREESSGGTYTAQGLKLNAHWLRGAGLVNRDGDDFENTGGDRTRHVVLDRHLTYYDHPGTAVAAGGSMAVNSLGWLFRAYVRGANVRVDRSMTAGLTWTTFIVATDASSASIPSISVNRFDDLFVWYHNASSAYVYKSDNHGATWTLQHDYLTITYPRAVYGDEEMWVAYYDDLGSDLIVVASPDQGATLNTVEIIVDIPAQRPELVLDRRGVLHLVYMGSGGDIRHRWSDDGGRNFSDPANVLVAAGENPALAVGVERGILVYFDGADPKALLTDETFSEPGPATLDPIIAYNPQVLGVVVDERGVTWVNGTALDEEELQYSQDPVNEWTAV